MATDDGTVGKAMDVLELVALEGRPLRFAEVQARSPYPKATLHRLLQSLVHQGLLTQDETTQTYAPGLRLVRLAHMAWAQASLAPIARGPLDALAAELGETIHLAQLDQGQVLYVDKRNAARPIEMFSQAGKVGPAYCTGVGKAMLAHLPPETLERVLQRQSFHRFTPQTLTTRAALLADLETIRRDGYALDREEHEAGIICIAVPILARSGRAIGALSVTSSTARTTLAALIALAPQLRQTAEIIAQNAALWRAPEPV